MSTLSGLSRIVRASEWWEYKMPPILGVGYATAFYIGIPLIQIASTALFFLASLAIGAVYVSLINDLTDMEADSLVGKPNHMAKIPRELRVLFPVCCLLIGSVFGYLMWPDVRSVLLYAGAWIAFSLYSIPPFRFKERGILGVGCDASGAHLFPTCLLVSGIYFMTGTSMDLIWFSAAAIWSLCFGLRGILWHQFLDRENDLVTRTRTFATDVEPHQFRSATVLIFCVEMVAFGGLLHMLELSLSPLLLVVYALLVCIRYRRYHHQPILIMTPKDSPFQVLMLDYYQVFFPIGLLIVAAIHQSYGVVLLVVHVLLFPRKLMAVGKDFAKAILK